MVQKIIQRDYQMGEEEFFKILKRSEEFEGEVTNVKIIPETPNGPAVYIVTTKGGY